jgi:hypothetical protein
MYAGKIGKEDADRFPFPMTKEVLERGRNRFNIYCSPCHGYTGHGNGMIPRRGLQSPPSYHSDAFREMPVGHFFDVISNGTGAMASYAAEADELGLTCWIGWSLRGLSTGDRTERSPDQRNSDENQ